MPYDRYVDVLDRKKHVQEVKLGLKDYVTRIQVHTGKMTEDGEKEYYRLITDCVRQLWEPGLFIEEKIGLLEAERRIRQVVRPTLTTALGLRVVRGVCVWVYELWFMHPKTITEIDENVKKWFGDQTADAVLRAQCLYGLYEVCEYWHPDAYGLSGLSALKEACWSIYLDVGLAVYWGQYQMQALLGPMWALQAAREAFEASVAGVAVTDGTRTEAAEIDKLLENVLSDIDKLVNILYMDIERKKESVSAEGERARDDENKKNAKKVHLCVLLQKLQECV
jgi:hypothetical protein